MENKKKLISIITVVFNAKNSILRTINSVLKYKSDEIEYVIIDGGSTDGTIDIIKKFENEIDVFISERDWGIYDAMNKGILKSTGNYILNINSGDELMLNPLVFLDRDDLIKRKYNMFLFNVLQSDGQVFSNRVSKALKIYNTIHHQGVLYLSDHSKLYDLKYSVFSDFDYNQRIYKEGIDELKVEENICLHDLGGVSHFTSNFEENYSITLKNFGMTYVFYAFLYYKIRGLRAKFNSR